CLALIISSVFAQETVIVRPREIDSVLTNPGIGFNTFQRFNGDTLNAGEGWTEGYPIEYQVFDGDLTNPDHPATSTAYFRIYWRYVEPEMDKYNWAMLDRALKTAHQRGQTLLLRIAPYGGGPKCDVPDWLRKLIPEDMPRHKWRVDAENPLYVEHFTDMVRDVGARYDGHPDLELVDMALVGYWGEGSWSRGLTQQTREALVDSYIEAFRKTPLVMLLTDEKTNKYGLSKRDVGWRVDCLGDLGFGFKPVSGWRHMYDCYPQRIIDCGMRDAWKKAPVTLEICGTMRRWKDREGYGKEEVKYIFDQALKWHISSFNAKSSPVPEEWRPLVNDWLKKMGYRFVLRKFTYPSEVRPHGKLAFTTWWENKGVAPCYRRFPLALRLKSATRSEIFLTDADIREWLPGDNLYDDAVFLPPGMPEGEYELGLSIVDAQTRQPKVKIAIEGAGPDGWYRIGGITVREILKDK
ncbi:MAG: DUF4832 domain-containing protein, partial [Gemmatimonadota bacterium]|nr:DUF4832 domain-containing protein [Gemmatimonadota bacterium]